MSMILIREIPGSLPMEIVRFEDNGKVFFASKLVETAMKRIGISIPVELQAEFGGEGKVKLCTTEDGPINPFFKRAYQEIYVPAEVANKGPGTVRWIRKEG